MPSKNQVPDHKPGNQPPHQVHTNDRTPPHKGDPQQVQNVPGREDHKRSHRPDVNETYRTGRQGKR